MTKKVFYFNDVYLKYPILVSLLTMTVSIQLYQKATFTGDFGTSNTIIRNFKTMRWCLRSSSSFLPSHLKKIIQVGPIFTILFLNFLSFLCRPSHKLECPSMKQLTIMIIILSTSGGAYYRYCEWLFNFVRHIINYLCGEACVLIHKPSIGCFVPCPNNPPARLEDDSHNIYIF